MIRPSRFGIWTRLLLSFGLISVITVLAGLTAVLIFDRSSELFATITEKHLPEVVQVAEFAEIGGQIIAIAPNLISAPEESTRKKIAADLDNLLQRVKQQIELLEITSPKLKQKIDILVHDLKTNLTTLHRLVRVRLQHEHLLNKKRDQLRWLYADMLDEIEPLNQDLSYNLDAEIERLIGSSLQSNKKFSVTRLRSNRLAKEAIETIGSNGVLLVNLILQAPTTVDDEQLDHLKNLSEDTISLLKISLKKLGNQASSLTLRQVLADIFSLAEGESSVFSVKKLILAETLRSKQVLVENRKLVSQLRTLTEQIVTNARTRAFAAVSGTKKTLSHARWLLILMGVLSLITAASVLWFYVRGNIVARLNKLEESMQAIADGDLAHEIPPIKDDEIGKMTAALKVFRDTAQAMEDAHAQAIIDNADVGLIIADPDGSIRFFNSMATKLFGAESETMVGHSLFNIVAVENRDKFKTLCHDILSGHSPTYLARTFHAVRQDDSVFPVDISIHPVQQRHQRRLIITVHDVTEREKAHELLKTRVREKTDHLSRINVKLRQEVKERKRVQDELVQAGKLAALGQLSTGIAHEINQPLAAIRHYIHNANLLIERGDIETHRHNLEKIEDLTERMAKTINHLKTFARWPTNQLSSVDLLASIERALSLFSIKIDQLKIAVERRYDQKKEYVLAEDIRLEQVLVNIIGNAVDAVSEQPEGQRLIAIEIETEEQFLKVAIVDSGAGIQVEQKETIFDPFYTTKTVGQGLGLGLSISYNIIKDFGGNIDVEDDTAGGTRFTMILQSAQD